MLQEEPSDARVCCKRRREQGRKYPRLAQIEPRSVKLAECQKRVDCIDVWRRFVEARILLIESWNAYCDTIKRACWGRSTCGQRQWRTSLQMVRRT